MKAATTLISHQYPFIMSKDNLANLDKCIGLLLSYTGAVEVEKAGVVK